MKTGSKMIIIGCIFIVMGLPLFLYGDLLPDIFAMLLGVFWIIIGVFKNKGYYDKSYFMSISSVIALWGLMLLYIFLFRTNEYLRNTDIFYILVGLFVFLVLMLSIAYIRNRKALNL